MFIRYLKTALFSLFLFFCFALTNCPGANAQLETSSTATKLIIYNASSKVVVMVLCGGTPGVSGLKVKQISPTPGTGVALTAFGGGGYFIMKTGEKWQLYNPTSPYTMSAVAVGIGQFPSVCSGTAPAFPNVNNPTGSPVFPAIPNGTNGFECNLNLASQEAMNISCNKGANCTMGLTITPPASGPYWQTATCGPGNCGSTANNTSCSGTGSTTNCTRTFTSTTTTQNSWVNVALSCDNNCVDSTGCPRNGVYPYGCSQCNLNPDPAPSCGAQFCAAQNGNGHAAGNANQGTGCQYTRGPFATYGGTVQLTYVGPLTPPTSCPTPTTAVCPSK